MGAGGEQIERAALGRRKDGFLFSIQVLAPGTVTRGNGEG
jgi:hypothetical protein